MNGPHPRAKRPLEVAQPTLSLSEHRELQLLKGKAKAAFAAYDSAVREGDAELAEICANRFRQASSSLAMWRERKGRAAQ